MEHTMSWRVLCAFATLFLVCTCGCVRASTGVCQARATNDTWVLGSDYDTKVLCDKMLAKLLGHSIAICQREIGASGTDRGRKDAFWDIKRDVEGVRGLLDATYAARAMENPRAGKDPVLENMIAAGIRECERQVRSEESSEERRVALIGMRSLIVGVRELLKTYYSTAGLQWPDDTTTGEDQTVPSPTGR